MVDSKFGSLWDGVVSYELLGLGYGKILGGVGESYQIILDLR